MKRRALAAYLWIAAGWSLGAVGHEVAGVTEYVGLALGVVAAAVVLLMPAETWNLRVDLRALARRTAAGTSQPVSMPLPQPR